MEQPPKTDAILDAEPLDASDKKSRELKDRIIYGSFAALTFLLVLVAGGVLFQALLLAAALIMLREWDNLTQHENAKWKNWGLVYVGAPCLSLMWLREASFEGYSHAGISMVLFLILVIWATDIGAYFTGKRFGRLKLAPTISPGKTWEGLAGGMLAAAIVGAACSPFTPFPPSIGACAFWGALLAIIAQCGDLFESWVKRRAGVKDSGNLLPGHGGLLDRVDGLIFTTPILAMTAAYWGAV